MTLPEGIKTIESLAFSGSGIQSIILPDGLTAIGGNAFSHCISLTSIDIPDGVTSIGSSVFSYCTSLTDVSLPGGLKSIGQMAFSKTAIKSIVLPEGITSLAEYSFSECTDLTSITIPDTVAYMGRFSFSKCSKLPIIAAERTSAVSVKVSWDAVEGATKYEVYRAASLGGTYTRITATDKLSYENTGLYVSKTYYYKVRAYTKVGSVNVYGPYSEKKYA